MKGERGNLRGVIEGAKRISPGLGTKTLGQEDFDFARNLGGKTGGGPTVSFKKKDFLKLQREIDLVRAEIEQAVSPFPVEERGQDLALSEKYARLKEKDCIREKPS